jgi:hypothetical protein
VRLTIKGKRWRVVEVDSFRDPKQGGECDYEARVIRILRSLTWPERLRVLIHEVMHAYDKKATERKVDTVSSAIRDVLRRDGYRRKRA